MRDVSELLALREGTTPGPISARPLQNGEGDFIPGFQWYLYSSNYGAVGYWTGHKQAHQDERWYLTEADAKLFAASHTMLDALEAQAREIAALTASAEAAGAKLAKAGVIYDGLVSGFKSAADEIDYRCGCPCCGAIADQLREIGGGNG